mgnify:CR=1 FL=1
MFSFKAFLSGNFIRNFRVRNSQPGGSRRQSPLVRLGSLETALFSGYGRGSQQEGRCHAAIPSPIFLRNSIIPKRNSSKLNLKRENVFCFTCILAGQARQLLADVRRFLLSFSQNFVERSVIWCQSESTNGLAHRFNLSVYLFATARLVLAQRTKN